MPTTANEQYLLELINDARLNPLGDAARYLTGYAPLGSAQANIQQALSYFGVSGSQLLAAFQALAPAQPLAFSDSLAAGARAHDQAMIAAGLQAHQVTNEDDFPTRLGDDGYAARYAAENVFAYGQDMLFVQASLMVDWGGSAASGGMQVPAGHRTAIMNPLYREVGVGVVDDPNDANGLGPEVVTEDFGSLGTSGTFLLGVAYNDTDHDGFYSVGEGVSGLTASVGGISATSSASGGWTLATNLVGQQTVQLTGGGLAGAAGVTMALTDAAGNGLNAKLDVINGSVLHLSNSATVTGPVIAIQALGVQAVTIVEGDAISRTLTGNAGGDRLIGGGGNDVIQGGVGNDVIDGGAGANTLDGGAGFNTVVFDFASTAATVSRSGAAWVVSAPGTQDVLTNFQQYQFTDKTMSFLFVPSPDPLFDPAYYLANNPDVAAAGVDPYTHYMTVGWKEGRNPDAYFNTTYYLNQNPDVRAAGINPLTHFETNGWKEGRDPSVVFSDSTYLAAYPDVRAAGIDPLLHYVVSGLYEGRTAFGATPHATGPQDPLVDAGYVYAHNPGVAAGGLDASAWYNSVGWKQGANPDAYFDTNYYLTQNPDVRAAGIDPLTHFEVNGWKEGRDPSLVFSDGKYLAAYPDVGAAGIDPLLHYELNGRFEGRAAFNLGGAAAADSLVNTGYYDSQLGATLIPAGAAADQQATYSYQTTGWQRGLNPNAYFNTSYYLSHNPDVAAAHIDPLFHYENYGWKEGRDPSANFSTNKYLAAYPDVRGAGIDPLLHFINNGQAEGRQAFAV